MVTHDMIDHAFLASLVSTLTGLPTLVDPAQPEPFVSPTIKARIFVQVKAAQALGWDEFVRVFDADLNKNVITQSANRLFVMSLRAESFVPGLHAHDVLEYLRIRLFRPSTLAQIRTKNMTATSAEATVDLPTSYDSRVISAASLDVHMAFRYRDLDESDDGNWIDTFDLEYDPGA